MFLEIDKTKRILFRYTSNNGNFFARGQKLNGWDLSAVYYFETAKMWYDGANW